MSAAYQPTRPPARPARREVQGRRRPREGARRDRDRGRQLHGRRRRRSISFPDQRLAQLEIQHAYWALLSPDQKERSGSGVGASDAPGAGQLREVRGARHARGAARRERRVPLPRRGGAHVPHLLRRFAVADHQRAADRDRDAGRRALAARHVHAVLARRARGHQVRGRRGQRADHAPERVRAGEHARPRDRARVRDAWPTPTRRSTSASLRSRADPRSARSSRRASRRTTRTRARPRSRSRGGARSRPTRIEILYSLQTEGGPSTPWPSTGAAEKTFDGHWYAAPQFACGISGLASGALPGCRGLGRDAPGHDKWRDRAGACRRETLTCP